MCLDVFLVVHQGAVLSLYYLSASSHAVYADALERKEEKNEYWWIPLPSPYHTIVVNTQGHLWAVFVESVFESPSVPNNYWIEFILLSITPMVWNSRMVKTISTNLSGCLLPLTMYLSLSIKIKLLSFLCHLKWDLACPWISYLQSLRVLGFWRRSHIQPIWCASHGQLCEIHGTNVSEILCTDVSKRHDITWNQSGHL